MLEESISSAMGAAKIQEKDKMKLIEIQNLKKELTSSVKWPEMQSLVRSSEPMSEHEITNLISRYLGRNLKSGSCLAITNLQEGRTEVVGLVLTVDELQNWGPGSYTTVTDILLARSFFQ